MATAFKPSSERIMGGSRLASERCMIDSNILIAFKKINKLDLLLSFFKSNPEQFKEVCIPECIFNEVKKYSIGRYITDITPVIKIEKYVFTNEELDSVKRDCQKVISKTLHTKNDNDYRFILAVLKQRFGVVLSNDRDILRYLDVRGDGKSIKTYNIVHLIKLLRETDATFSIGDFAEANLEIYGQDELPGLFKQMSAYEQFLNEDKITSWTTDFQNIFSPYKDSVIEETKRIQEQRELGVNNG